LTLRAFLQRSEADPKSSSNLCRQALFYCQAVLGAAAVGGGAFLERQDKGFGDVSDQELCHKWIISHITRTNLGW